MADNIGYTPGTGATVAADEISGVLYQRVKIAAGADGSATDVSDTDPLPTDVESVAIPTAIYNGQNTVASAGTAEAIGSSQAILSGVTVKALAGNSGLVYIGNSGVDSANGFELAAGEQIFVEVANVATVYVDSATNDDGVSWIAS